MRPFRSTGVVRRVADAIMYIRERSLCPFINL